MMRGRDILCASVPRVHLGFLIGMVAELIYG